MAPVRVDMLYRIDKSLVRFLLVHAIAIGCGGISSPETDEEEKCSPGQTESCRCSDGEKGEKVCLDSQRYSSCQCEVSEGEDSIKGSDGGSSDNTRPSSIDNGVDDEERSETDRGVDFGDDAEDEESVVDAGAIMDADSEETEDSGESVDDEADADSRDSADTATTSDDASSGNGGSAGGGGSNTNLVGQGTGRALAFGAGLRPGPPESMGGIGAQDRSAGHACGAIGIGARAASD